MPTMMPDQLSKQDLTNVELIDKATAYDVFFSSAVQEAINDPERISHNQVMAKTKSVPKLMYIKVNRDTFKMLEVSKQVVGR